MVSRKPKSPGNRAALYLRVSTAQQARDGESLDTQLDRLRAYCAMRGLSPAVEVPDPAQSGGKPLSRRKGGRQLTDAIEAGQVDAVVVAKLDRAWRNAVDCLTTIAAWDRRGVAVHILDMGGSSIDSRSAVGRLFLTLLAGFAEFERNRTAERVSETLAHKFAAGRLRLGSDAPYGWRYQGQSMVPVASEQTIRSTVLALAGEGLRAPTIVKRLDAAGLRNRDGGRFTSMQVYRVLRGCKRVPA